MFWPTFKFSLTKSQNSKMKHDIRLIIVTSNNGKFGKILFRIKSKVYNISWYEHVHQSECLLLFVEVKGKILGKNHCTEILLLMWCGINKQSPRKLIIYMLHKMQILNVQQTML